MARVEDKELDHNLIRRLAITFCDPLYIDRRRLARQAYNAMMLQVMGQSRKIMDEKKKAWKVREEINR